MQVHGAAVPQVFLVPYPLKDPVPAKHHILVLHKQLQKVKFLGHQGHILPAFADDPGGGVDFNIRIRYITEKEIQNVLGGKTL